jgi:hypothetical protein
MQHSQVQTMLASFSKGLLASSHLPRACPHCCTNMCSAGQLPCSHFWRADLQVAVIAACTHSATHEVHLTLPECVDNCTLQLRYQLSLCCCASRPRRTKAAPFGMLPGSQLSSLPPRPVSRPAFKHTDGAAAHRLHCHMPRAAHLLCKIPVRQSHQCTCPIRCGPGRRYGAPQRRRACRRACLFSSTRITVK